MSKTDFIFAFFAYFVWQIGKKRLSLQTQNNHNYKSFTELDEKAANLVIKH